MESIAKYYGIYVAVGAYIGSLYGAYNAYKTSIPIGKDNSKYRYFVCEQTILHQVWDMIAGTTNGNGTILGLIHGAIFTFLSPITVPVLMLYGVSSVYGKDQSKPKPQ